MSEQKKAITDDIASKIIYIFIFKQYLLCFITIDTAFKSKFHNLTIEGGMEGGRDLLRYTLISLLFIFFKVEILNLPHFLT